MNSADNCISVRRLDLPSGRSGDLHRGGAGAKAKGGHGGTVGETDLISVCWRLLIQQLEVPLTMLRVSWGQRSASPSCISTYKNGDPEQSPPRVANSFMPAFHQLHYTGVSLARPKSAMSLLCPIDSKSSLFHQAGTLGIKRTNSQHCQGALSARRMHQE